MGKLEKYIYLVIILVLVTAIVSGSIYLVMRDKDSTNTDNNKEVNDKDKENNKGETEELIDGVKLIDVKKQEDKIVETFEIVLNGKKKEMNFQFEYEKNEIFDLYVIKGNYKNFLIHGSDYSLSDTSIDKVFSVDSIKENFNSNNFKIIKGEDNKNYLGIIANRNNDDILYIFNDNLENIIDDTYDDYDRSIEIIPGVNDKNSFMITTYYNTPCGENMDAIWYKNAFNIKNKTNFALKIEDNKLYYLAFKLNDYPNSTLEERVYTINNSKLSYTVINEYFVGKDICQQA